MNARLIPDRSPRFTWHDLPCIPSPNTRRALPSLLRCSTSVTGSPVASAFRVWTSPCIRRLVATYGRIVFVILRAACSLPAALHPASQRRSYLQLSGMSIPRERTFTSLIAPAPGRTDTGLRRYDDLKRGCIIDRVMHYQRNTGCCFVRLWRSAFSRGMEKRAAGYC